MGMAIIKILGMHVNRLRLVYRSCLYTYTLIYRRLNNEQIIFTFNMGIAGSVWHVDWLNAIRNAKDN